MGGRVVEMNVLVTLEPPIAPRLVGGEIVEHDMDLAFRICGDDPVHEIEEFDAPASLVVAAQDLAAADVQGGEQRGRSMPLIICDCPVSARPLGSFR
jgi:hypothetical protein